MTLDEQIRSALRIAKHIAETGGDGLEERQVDEIKALIATQAREARIEEATLFNRYFDDNLAFKGFAEERLKALKGDDK